MPFTRKKGPISTLFQRLRKRGVRMGELAHMSHADVLEKIIRAAERRIEREARQVPAV